jgi:hypothetical protein
MSTDQDNTIEINLKRNRLFIILGAAGVTLLLVLLVSIYIFNGKKNNHESIATEINLCDMDTNELCIVTFGANSLNRMVINFKLPEADYPGFYVKAKSRGTINVYSCETADEFPTSTYCTGIRTPLGEAIDIEVYSTDGDTLMAYGTFMVSAILLSTPEGFLLTEESRTAQPTFTDTVTPNPTEEETTPTPTTDAAYPNLTSETAYPNP